MGKYLEGDGKMMREDRYYIFQTHDDCPPNIPDHYYIGNYILMEREYIIDEYGGFDMRFEGSGVSHQELAMRLQKFDRVEIKLTKNPIVACDHMPGISGDHGPMHYAHILIDNPLFHKMMENFDKIEYLIDK